MSENLNNLILIPAMPLFVKSYCGEKAYKSDREETLLFDLTNSLRKQVELVTNIWKSLSQDGYMQAGYKIAEYKG